MSDERVLIVDDEPDIRELLDITLSRMGLETFSAATLGEAQSLVSEVSPDLCLTDMKLPDGNGIHLVEYIQEAHSHIPVAMITAHGSVETAISALKAGAFDFISKPIELETLRNLVSSALQLESAAHVKVELLMTQLLQQPNIDVCADSFFQTLHREFYERMPDEFRILPSGKIIEPGEFRKGEVEVGAHLAPTFGSLSRFMSRFASAYDLKNLDPLDRVIAAAASHHRFAWIHPFQDGNGRVARLFTHAYLARAGVETAGLWALSRGFARRRDDPARGRSRCRHSGKRLPGSG